MKTMTRKGYGRIYTDKPENVEKIKETIKQIDEYEFDYLPEGFIAMADDYPKVVYTHKFCDMDMDGLTAECWKRGVHIWIFDAGHNEFPSA